tara:strand:+ start:1297 stop:1614 length:318 start_codon:yes stop_codon:yes gene_type:complete
MLFTKSNLPFLAKGGMCGCESKPKSKTKTKTNSKPKSKTKTQTNKDKKKSKAVGKGKRNRNAKSSRKNSRKVLKKSKARRNMRGGMVRDGVVVSNMPVRNRPNKK